MKVVTGKKEFFPGVGKINYEGAQSDNPLAYRWYDESKTVAGKSMKDHLRFACAYWHSFCGSGADPFGEPTHLFTWNEKSDAVERAPRVVCRSSWPLPGSLGLRLGDVHSHQPRECRHASTPSGP